MNIHLEYVLTPDHYYELQRGYTKNRKSLTPRSMRGLRSYSVVLWVAVIVFVLIIWNIPWDWFAPPAPPPPPPVPGVPAVPPQTWGGFLWSLVPFLFIFGMVYAFILWIRRSKLLYRRLAPELLRVDEPRTAEITDTHLTIREPRAVTQMEWGHFIRFIEMPSVFLLFATPRTSHILPKRGFPSTEAMAEFRAFAQAHVGNMPVGFPVELAKAEESAMGSVNVEKGKEPNS